MFFFSSRRRHTSWPRDWSSDVCSSDLLITGLLKHVGSGAGTSPVHVLGERVHPEHHRRRRRRIGLDRARRAVNATTGLATGAPATGVPRSEEHTSELQSRGHLVCRLLLEKK